MNKLELSIKDSSISFVLGYLLSELVIVLFVIIGTIFFEIIGKSYESFSYFLNTALGYLVLISILNLSLLAIFLFYKRKRNLTVTGKFSCKRLLFYILIGLISYVLLYPLVLLVSHLINNCGINSPSLPYTISTKNYFISLLSLVVIPSICEELLFRGVIFKGLKKYGKVFSIVCSALMFSIFHMSVEQIIYPFLMGLLLAVIMYYENNIIYCIVVHFLNNFITLTLTYFNFNFFNVSALYISIAIIFACIFISLIFYFILRNCKTAEKTKISKNEKFYFLSSFIIMILFYIITFISI